MSAIHIQEREDDAIRGLLCVRVNAAKWTGPSGFGSYLIMLTAGVCCCTCQRVCRKEPLRYKFAVSSFQYFFLTLVSLESGSFSPDLSCFMLLLVVFFLMCVPIFMAILPVSTYIFPYSPSIPPFFFFIRTRRYLHLLNISSHFLH